MPFRLTSAHHCLLSPSRTPWGPEDEPLIPVTSRPGCGGGHRQATVNTAHSGKGCGQGAGRALETCRGGHFLSQEGAARFPPGKGGQARSAQYRPGGGVPEGSRQSDAHRAREVQRTPVQKDWNGGGRGQAVRAEPGERHKGQFLGSPDLPSGVWTRSRWQWETIKAFFKGCIMNLFVFRRSLAAGRRGCS